MELQTAPSPEASDAAEKKGKKKTLLIILLALLLAASLGALGYMAWNHFNPPAGDAGATVSKYEGMSREEVQAEIDRQTEESRMTISVADVLRFHFRSSRHHPVSNHQTHSDICAARSINCRSCGR